jgi:hypothetical protein
MIKFDKEQFEILKETHQEDLEVNKSELDDLLNDINGMIYEINDKIVEYNDKAQEITGIVSVFQQSVEELAGDLRRDFEGESDEFQESDNGVIIDGWVSEWDSYARDFDVYIDELEEIDEVDCSAVTIVEEAIEMIYYQHPEFEPELEEEEETA